jgi:hypothetical protein
MHEAKQYLENPDKPDSLHIQYKGRKRRIFRNEDGAIGIVDTGKKNSGSYFSDWDNITKIHYPLVEDPKIKERKLVLKYKREAAKATFSSPFIRRCLGSDESKSLYENRMTADSVIDGQIISLKTIEKWAGRYVMDSFRKAIKEKREYRSSRFPFQGYEGSLEITVHAEGNDYFQAGDIQAYFSKEYEDWSNGYYYQLINDDNFIGYDVD